MASNSQTQIVFPQIDEAQVRSLETLLGVAAGELGVEDQCRAALSKVLCLMAEGTSVTLLPHDQTITIQRAADLLSIPKPYLMKLLESGEMLYHRVGHQRRLYFRDVIAYREKRDAERKAALDQMSLDAFDAGLYHRNVMPEGGNS